MSSIRAAGPLAYWCVIEDGMVLCFLLLIVAMTGAKNFVNLYNVQGVWLQDLPPLWSIRRQQALKTFHALTPQSSSGPLAIGSCAQGPDIGYAQGLHRVCCTS